MSEPASNEELAEEARKWDSGEWTPKGWEDCPEAAPRTIRLRNFTVVSEASSFDASDSPTIGDGQS